MLREFASDQPSLAWHERVLGQTLPGRLLERAFWRVYFDGRAAQVHGPNGSQPATPDKQREVAREVNTAAQ